MNILVLTDHKISSQAESLARYFYRELCRLSESAEEQADKKDAVSMIQLQGNETFEESFEVISGLEPELVFTFDLAGLWLESEYQTVIYQYLYCKCIHILTKPPWYFPEELTKKMHILSSLVVFSEDQREYVRRFYENVPAVVCWPFEAEREKIRKIQRLFLEEERAGADQRFKQLPQSFLILAEKVSRLQSKDSESSLFGRIELALSQMDCPCSEEELTELTVLLRDTDLTGYELPQSEEAWKEPLLRTSIIELIRWSKVCDVFTV